MKNFRFFITKEDLRDDRIIIGGELCHKIKKVLRYKKGDEITLLESNKIKYFGKVARIGEQNIEIEILREETVTAREIFTTLYLSIIKSQKFEIAIQKATELGVNKIVPLMTTRSVVRIDEKSRAKKLNRWVAIATEAAAQSKRDDIPEITEIISVDELLHHDDDATIKIVCDERGGAPLKDYLDSAMLPLCISAAVGPEGGFTDNEMLVMSSAGFEPVLLSNNILRAETVPLFLMSAIQYEFGL